VNPAPLPTRCFIASPPRSLCTTTISFESLCMAIGWCLDKPSAAPRPAVRALPWRNAPRLCRQSQPRRPRASAPARRRPGRRGMQPLRSPFGSSSSSSTQAQPALHACTYVPYHVSSARQRHAHGSGPVPARHGHSTHGPIKLHEAPCDGPPSRSPHWANSGRPLRLASSPTESCSTRP
jgi:hypothetical protein